MIQVYCKWKLLLNGEEQAEHDWNQTIISGAIAVWKLEFPWLTWWGFLIKYVYDSQWHHTRLRVYLKLFNYCI